MHFSGSPSPLPQHSGLREKTLTLTGVSRDHLLMGVHSPEKDLVSFTIVAREARGESEKEARKGRAAPGSSKPKEIKIESRTVWRTESVSKVGDREMQTVAFSTAMGDYVLRFEIVSFNPEITTEIEQDIGQMTFFDPAQAKAMAGVDSEPYLPGASRFPATRIALLSPGSISENVYRNEELGFRYEFPQGWILMSKTAQEAIEAKHQFIRGNSPSIQEEHEAERQCTKNLLFVTRQLEESTAGQFNSRVLLIAVDPKCAPDTRYPKTVDDRDAMQRIAKQVVQYFKMNARPSTEPARVRAFNNAGRIMIEISQSFTVDDPGEHPESAIILSSTLLMQAGDYWVMWMFAARDKKELEELRNTKIFFDAPAPVVPK